MNKRRKNLVLIAIAALGSGYGLFWLGQQYGVKPADSMTTTPVASSKPGPAGTVDPATGRRVLYWHDPMVPGHRFDKPGKSPFMDMQLVPVYAGAANEGQVAIDPRTMQNLGIRTVEVNRSTMATPVEAVGNVAYNERKVTLVQARGNGYLEKLYVRALLDPVRKGQRLADLYVPDWVAAQEEYLAVRAMQGSDTEALVSAARQRMRLAGMMEDQIRQVEASGKVSARLAVLAPATGVVTELSAREGMTVTAGAPLFRINGTSTIWVHAELPETLSTQVRPGSPVEARAPALPDAVFKGKVSAILPEVSTTTRTLKARVELDNPGGRLVPGMFANLRFTAPARTAVLSVPTEAVIQTGQRSVVIVALEGGYFKPVDVEPGVEGAGMTEIRRGLEAGQRVVASGQFLIDSEASLKGALGRMSEAPRPDAAAVESRERKGAPSRAHKGTATVEAVDKDEITLSHGPIASMKWPAMTMGFQLPGGDPPADIKVGDSVSFEFRETGEGGYTITSLTKASVGKGARQ